MPRRQLLVAGIVLLLVAGAASSRSSRRRAAHSDGGASFDYYLLTLSWAPDFCAGAGANQDPRECGPGRRLGFVVHGLWPQSNSGRGPENCGSVSPVSASIVSLMLNYIPSESLIQHEWRSHGSCTGLTADQYFAQVRKARDSVKIPDAFSSLTSPINESASQLEAQFAAANPGLPKTAFRATCRNGMLQEARICLDKNLNAQACTASAGECTAGTMQILPPR